MSMTLILWKAPVVREADEAAALLEPFYERSDESVFEPSPDVAAVASELLRRFPDGEDAPWADGPPPPDPERVLWLTIRWKADNAVLDAIVELARKHRLVLYDPQGPDVTLPDDPIDDTPVPPPRPGDYVTFVGMGLAALGIVLLGWWIDVPVLRWVLMIGGGFFLSVVLFLLYILLFESKEETR